jgi:hypothetical protein
MATSPRLGGRVPSVPPVWINGDIRCTDREPTEVKITNWLTTASEATGEWQKHHAGTKGDSP